MKLRIQFVAGILAASILVSILTVRWLQGQALAAVHKPTQVVIRAVLYDGYASGDADEAVQLQNNIFLTTTIAGWQLSDGSSSTASFPAGTELAPWQTIWVARDGSAFTTHFGFPPDFETVDSSPAIPNMEGIWPRYTNSGDRVMLVDEQFNFIDVLLYKEVTTPQLGWAGVTVQPYLVNGIFAEEGQILQRKVDPLTNQVFPDTDTAADWIQDPDDPIWGKQVRYPGWDSDQFQQPVTISSQAALTVAIAPDNSFDLFLAEISAATDSIQAESLTFEHVGIANALVAAAGRGATVTLLLEGGPAGGLTDQERYVCQQLEAAGGACWFMVNDPAQDVFDRYRYLHAKFMIIDGRRVVLGSENLSPRSLPDDQKGDGTWGRRGVFFATSDPALVSQLSAVFQADFAPALHQDLRRWSATDPVYGAPPADFKPELLNGGITYTVRFSAPVQFQAPLSLTLLQAPDNMLHPDAGLLTHINEAGPGSVIRVMQLNERPHWGPSNSTSLADPNVRLEAYIAAAQRGARVRILLDAYFADPSDPLGNQATCAYVHKIAMAEHLDLSCLLGNPAGLGIHNKMILIDNPAGSYAIVGSVNGTELSHKGNREVALLVQSSEVHDYLAMMFDWDWPKTLYFPVVYNEFRGRADHLLISEVLYDPAGPDDAEFIELVNPTGNAIDLSNYRLSDAVEPDDFEDSRIFPAGTVLPAGEALVIATTATGFQSKFGFLPDFEILSTHPLVPDLIDDPAWGDPATFLQLGNGGDEVILRNDLGIVIDLLVYGSGSYPGVAGCPLVAAPDHSLERYPFWRDSDVCADDFRDWAFPNPGQLP
ncbi:MAG: lamin tail domain-containing protein [Anaerolineales bacterium]|nr:lamin tail domain-containing protein [Anaerolineales bacterium]